MPDERSAFRSYLEAKFDLDSASLNPRVAALFREKICAAPSPRLLDLGTGTGAMLRRLLDLPLRGETLMMGLDRDAGSLTAARRRLVRVLRAGGWQVEGVAADRHPAGHPAERSLVPPALPAVRAQRGRRRLRVELLCGDLLEPELPPAVAVGGFRGITAHAVLDLLPLAWVLRRLRPLLEPGGLLYATLNYDGVTTLLPPEVPGGLEERLLAEYDRSMERRRAAPGGAPTGGAHSGRRLYAAALEEGFTVLGVGPSDWCLFPYGGGYTDSQRVFLRAMLSFIAGEGARLPRLPAEELRSWHARRLAQIRQGRLALVVHQLDLLLSVR